MRYGALGLLAVFFLSPIAALLSQTNFAELAERLQTPIFQKSLWVTFITSTASSGLSCVMGLFLAKFFAHYEWRFKRFQKLLLIVPYLTPNFILAMAYVLCWNPTSGVLNGIIKFPGELYGITGMTWLFAVSHMPVSFLLLEDKLRRMDSSLIEASQISGATKLKTFLKIELPLVFPSVIASFSLCFSLSISAFAIPAWIGAPDRAFTLTYKIYETIQTGGLDGLSEAAGISSVLFLISLLPFALGRFLRGNEKKYNLLSGKSARLLGQGLGFKTFFGFQLVASLLIFLGWVLPLLALVSATLVPPGCLQSNGFACFSEISFGKYYYVLFELKETQAAIFGSFIYGSLASLIVSALSVGCLMLFYRHEKLRDMVASIFNIPLATCGAILALGLIVLYSGKYGINLYNSAWMAVMAYVIKHMSLAFQPVITGFSNISSSLGEAALVSGATRSTLWRKIYIPILTPEVFGGFFLVFIPILGELTMSVFLASPKFKNIGTVLFDLQDYADAASASSLAVLLIIFILMLNQAAKILSHGKLGY